MKVVHIIPRVITQSSGVGAAVLPLCGKLAGLGVDTELHLTGLPPAGIDGKVDVHSYRTDPCLGWACGSMPMLKGLIAASETADIIHCHSLWLLPNVYPGWIFSKNRKAKLIVSPHGTLSMQAWSRSRWKKRILWRIGQYQCLKSAAIFHATALSEMNDIRQMGFSQAASVIGNGVALPELNPPRASRATRRLLFLSRIHPIKGVDSLLRVWQRLQSEFPSWELQIAGPLDGGYPEQMQALAAELNLSRVVFSGELNGLEKARAFNEADLFVLPTQSENFGIVVAEALASATPAVVTTGAPWSGLDKHDCGWWIEQGEGPLMEALSEAMRLSPQRLREMGAAGRAWVQRDFSWERVATQMLDTYEWIIGGGNRPACVHKY